MACRVGRFLYACSVALYFYGLEGYGETFRGFVRNTPTTGPFTLLTVPLSIAS